jgi:hypothetical protein
MTVRNRREGFIIIFVNALYRLDYSHGTDGTAEATKAFIVSAFRQVSFGAV